MFAQLQSLWKKQFPDVPAPILPAANWLELGLELDLGLRLGLGLGPGLGSGLGLGFGFGVSVRARVKVQVRVTSGEKQFPDVPAPILPAANW